MPITHTLYQQSAVVLTATAQSHVFGSNAKHVEVTVAASSVSGTTPTLAVSVQVQGEDGTWVSALTPTSGSITANGTTVFTVPVAGITQNEWRVMRLNYAVGGTTPSFTVTATAVAK